MSDVDVQLLSRLLKTLDRSVRAGEDLDPFPQTSSGMATTNGLASAKSSPVKKSRKSKKAKEGDGEGEGEEQDMADELNQNLKEPSVGEVELEKLTRTLDLAIDSIVAADCCIALLASDRLPKQVSILLFRL
jgi:cohesin loading factor subunit SCC2